VPGIDLTSHLPYVVGQFGSLISASLIFSSKVYLPRQNDLDLIEKDIVFA